MKNVNEVQNSYPIMINLQVRWQKNDAHAGSRS